MFSYMDNIKKEYKILVITFLFLTCNCRNNTGPFIHVLNHSPLLLSFHIQGTLDVGLIDSVCASDNPDR